MFEQIINEATIKATQAAETYIPSPMTVVGRDKSYFVADGICGNATIRFKANTKFAKWALKNNIAIKSMQGARIRNKLCSQSYARNKAYADTFVTVLAQYDISAYVDSYID